MPSAKWASLSSWGLLFLAVQVFWAVTALPVLAQDTSKSPLVVMGDKDYPPYESLVDGKPVGINVELWREIAKILGQPLDLRLYQWADAQARVRRGEAKVLTFMSFNKERDKLYDFTQSTFTARFPIFVTTEIAAQFDISDLTGKRIAVKKGGFPRTLLETIHPEAEMVFVDSALEGFRKLLRGEVDGVMEDERVGYTILRQNDFHGIRATPNALAVKTGHIAVVKGNPALLRQIDEALRALKASGRFDQIADKWAGLEAVLIKKETIKLIVIWGLAALVLILGLGGVVYVLRIRKINVALSKEITERIQAEELLKESEERFRSVIDNSPSFINLKGADGRFQLVNRKHVEIFGLEPPDVFGKSSFDLYPEKQAEEATAHDRKVLEKKSAITEERQIFIKQGTRDFLITKFPILDGLGDDVRIGTIGTDITERKQAEEALRKSEELFKDVAETALDYLWEQDENFRFTFFHSHRNPIPGYSPDGVAIGKTRWEMVGGDPENDPFWREHFETLKAHKPFHDLSYEYLGSDGITYSWVVNGKPVFDDDGAFKGYRGAGANITKLRQAEKALREREEQLRQSQKMEAVGQLTGGVAHDFNNLLAVINGNLELVMDTGGLEDETREMLNRASEAVDKGATLTDQLLSFSRRQTLNPKTIEANTLLFDTISLLMRTLGEDIDIKTAFDTHIPLIKVDPGMLENAILNMALNARDAMPKGGTLTIKTTGVDLDGEVLYDKQNPLTGPHVLISISDTGKGIRKKDLNHVFEPFFTTKGVGEGSGLGLSMVYGFVKQSGGHVTIDSKRRKGTTVNLYFPAAESLDAETEEKAASQKSEPKGTETILVVEDDEDVRQVTVAMLNRLGYEVLEAEDGPSALKALSKTTKNVDLVFSDVIMPSGMSGYDLADELRRHYQGIKVMMTSGYPEKIIDRGGIGESGITLLRKPYKKVQLAEAVRTALDQQTVRNPAFPALTGMG